MGLELVYDFEVFGLHNYFAGGVIHSNSSKSHSAVVETVLFATGTHPYRHIETPNKIWSVSPTLEMSGSIVWKKMEPLLQGFDYHVTWMNRPKGIPDRVKIIVPGGESEIIFKSYEQRREAFQGADVRAICFDEQGPQDIYEECISRIGAAQALDFWSAMTPIIPQEWLESKLKNPPTYFDVFEFPLDDNRKSVGGFIDDDEIQRVIEEWPEEMQETRRRGKWASFIGAVYKTFNRDVHVVTPDVEISEKYLVNGKVPNTSFCFGSIDWGGNNPFVFLLGYKIPHLDNEWYIFDEYYWDYRKKGERLIRDHAAEIKRRVKSYDTSLHATYADHDVQDRAEMAASGVGTHPAAKEVLVGIEFVQSLLKVRSETGRPRLHIASRCEQTIKQMSSLRWPDATINRDPQDVPVKKDDHAADALRYLCYSENKSAAPKKIVKPWSEPRKF